VLVCSYYRLPQKQGLLPVLAIDLTDQTDLVEHGTFVSMLMYICLNLYLI
jgi:hypothetical protein